MKDDIKLPPLPKGDIDADTCPVMWVHTDQQMKNYAREAIKADRKRRSEPEGWQLVPNDEVMQFAKELSRAIAQAVLQLPEIRALRKDAERYRRLRRGGIKDVAVVRGLDAMNYGSSGVASTYSEEIDGDDLDAAIDTIMEKQQ